MRHEVVTLRFTCDSLIRREDNEVRCPNTLLLVGTYKEISQYFTEAGWKSRTPLLAESAYEKHECPRRNHVTELPKEWVKDECV